MTAILPPNDDASLFRLVLESSPSVLIVVAEDERISLVNTQAENVFGYSREELLGQSIEILVPQRFRSHHTGLLSTFFAKPSPRAMGTGRDLVGTRKDGSEVPIEVGLSPLQVGAEQFVLVSIIDITERKRSADKIASSLREKEILLREIHHRVKNNLQIISSLLIMQAASVEDQDTVAKLQETEHRVKSMAMIHEQLYGHDEISSMDFAEYTRTLTQVLRSSYAKNAFVQCRVNASPTELTIDQAIPCGLILNELLTNAFKYACKDEQTAEIAVTLSSDSDDVYLTVSDQGPGLPPGFAWDRSRSLGLKIVRALTKQIKGQLEVGGPPGASFALRFPKKLTAGRA
jgi:PAS domain S-box-containing protein